MILGDLFDKSIPCQETLVSAFKLFSFIKKQPRKSFKIVREKNGEKEEVFFSGLPVFAIHGNHEFRGKDFANSLKVLEEAGSIIYLHASNVIIFGEKEKVALHGLGSVPEQKAREALNLWNPVPFSEMTNIVMLHQGFKELINFEDEMIASLSVEDLPNGFDLFANGHFHWNYELKDEKVHLVIPGSTVITQMKKLESEKKKCFLLYDSVSKKLNVVEIPNQRIFVYRKISFDKASSEEVFESVKTELGEIFSQNFSKKPLIKLKLSGSLEQGLNQYDLDFLSIFDEFGEKAILYVDKSFSKTDFRKKLQDLRQSQVEKKSISSIGLELLEKTLEETNIENFDTRRIFELLSEGNSSKVIEILSDYDFV